MFHFLQTLILFQRFFNFPYLFLCFSPKTVTLAKPVILITTRFFVFRCLIAVLYQFRGNCGYFMKQQFKI